MGLTYATLEIANSTDNGMARRQLMPEADVRRAEVRMLVDSGAYMLCLNEHIQAQLGLDIIDSTEGELADGTVVTMPVAGPVDLRFGNRQTSCRAVILPGLAEPLLGAIPMEDMDVLIHPKTQELIINPANPYIAKKSLK
jgi:clan AA aspartic protease